MRKIMKLMSLMAVLLLVLTACGNNSSTKGTDEDGNRDTLNVVISYEPGSLDGLDYTFMEYKDQFGIYEPLVTLVDGTSYDCRLAESYEVNEEGTVYTFTIRKGVKFHNGEEMTMADIQYSMERWLNDANEGYVISDYLADLSYDYDNYTVTFTLTGPILDFLNDLSSVPVVNQKAIEEGGELYGRSPVGTGPYKMVEWKATQYISVTRFDDYWGEKGLIKDINYRIIKETTSAIASLEKGEVDVLLGIPSAEIDRVSALDGITVETTDSPKQCYYFINTTNVDKPIRQAINLAIDRQAIIDLVENGHAHIPTSHIEGRISDPGKSYDYERNVEKAKQILADAGYSSGYTMTLLHNGSDDIKVAQIIQNSLADIGITLEIESIDSGAFWDQVMAKDFQMYGRTVSLSLPDAYAFIKTFASDNTSNFVSCSREDIDAAFEVIETLPDCEERTAQVEIAMDALYDEACLLPIYIGETNIVYNSNLKGLSVNRIDAYDLSKVSW